MMLSCTSRIGFLRRSLRHGGAGIQRCAPFSVATDEEERESMPFDVLIVGGGPAGLAASIRIKQLCAEQNKDLSVCLIDKGR